MTHGTKPKVPFDSKEVPRPKSTSFTPGLLQASMCLPCLPTNEKSTEDPLLLTIPPESVNSIDDAPLQINSLQIAPQVDAVLGHLAQDLETSVAQGSVSFSP